MTDDGCKGGAKRLRIVALRPSTAVLGGVQLYGLSCDAVSLVPPVPGCFFLSRFYSNVQVSLFRNYVSFAVSGAVWARANEASREGLKA